MEFHSTYKPSFYSSNLLATSYPNEKVPWTTAAWKVAIFPKKKLHTMFLTESCMYCKPLAIKKIHHYKDNLTANKGTKTVIFILLNIFSKTIIMHNFKFVFKASL